MLQNLGRRIMMIRESNGWTQEYLAERYGCTKQYIQRIEAGSQNVSVAILVRLANALHFPFLEMFFTPARSK